MTISIMEKELLEPIVVRSVDEGFEVVASNRRLGACRRLKLKKVPCHIVEFDDKGNILGKHRKIMPTGSERLVHGQGDGSTMKVYPSGLGEKGELICGEHTNKLACYALLALGEKVHAASWPAFPAQDEAEVVRTRTGMEVRSKYYAYAGKVFVVNSCGVLDDHALEVLGATDKRCSLISRGGGSSIVGPDGKYIAEPAGD